MLFFMRCQAFHCERMRQEAETVTKQMQIGKNPVFFSYEDSEEEEQVT